MNPFQSPLPKRSNTAAVLALSIGISLSGCAVVPNPTIQNDLPAARPLPANAAILKPEPMVRFAEDANNRYVRLEAASTGLVNVADDGQTTFAVFAQELAGIRVFDQEGKPLRHVRLRFVVAIEGRHAGILLKTPYGASYAAPNPRAPTAPLPSLASDPDLAEARTLLEAQGTHRTHFDRALALVDKPVNAPKPATEVTRPATLIVTPAPPPMTPADDTYVRQAGGVLMRVFFASGGRAVVRPDDGLMRLVREAQNAQQIRITGYTDSLGAASANTVLAQQRAEAIRHHLVRNGVPADRILMTWTGAADYLAENTTEKGRAMNRRVEVQMMALPLAERR